MTLIERSKNVIIYGIHLQAETSTINTPNSQIFIIIPREDSVISSLKSYLDLNFEVIKKAENIRYGDGNDTMLVHVRPFALFSKFKLRTSSGKHLEDTCHDHIVSLMYTLISSAEDTNDLSIGLDHSHNRTRDELTSIKNRKGKYHLRITLKDVFGFAKHQKKATYALGYNVTLTTNEDEAIIDKPPGSPDAGIKIDHIQWYKSHYTPSIQQQGILSKQIFKKTPTELRYIERSVFMKEVKNESIWNFELGSQENMDVPIQNIIGFKQKDRQHAQIFNTDAFCRLAVVSAQAMIGTEKHPDASIILNYKDDVYSQGYAQIREDLEI